MLFVIRADASQTIGSGHIMRCMTLAEKLKSNGAEVSFICRDYPGNLSNYILSNGFNVHLLPKVEAPKQSLNNWEKVWPASRSQLDAEETIQVILSYQRKIKCLIVDHYGIDYRWESYLRPWTNKIMVIDDLANRPHDCDILLDQNYYCNISERYSGLVPEKCNTFLGVKYLLLRGEFYKERKKNRVRNGEISNVLIFYGGADATNETEKCLMMFKHYANRNFLINVVTGQSNQNRDRIADICSSMPNVHYYCQVSNMAELINKADLAFGAGGSNIWERCYLGLPSVVTITAQNQSEVTEAVGNLGAILNLGWYDKVDTEILYQAFNLLIENPSNSLKVQAKALELMSETDDQIMKLINEILS